MTIKRQLSIVLLLPLGAACGLVAETANTGQANTGQANTGQAADGRVSAPSSSPQKRAVVTVAEAKKILARWDGAENEAMRRGGTDWSAAEAGLIAEIHQAEVRLNRLRRETPSLTPEERIVQSRFAIPRAGT